MVDGEQHLALVMGEVSGTNKTCWSGCTPSASAVTSSGSLL